MQVCIGRALLHTGDLAQASERLQPVVAHGSGVHLLFLVHALGTAATVEAWAGNLRAAERFGRQALDVAEAGGLGEDLGAADAYLALGVVARERNQLALAPPLLDEALARARQNRRHALLWAVYGELAELRLAQGQLAQGVRLLRETPGEGLPPAPTGVAARLRAINARLLLGTLDPDGAARVLGPPADGVDVTTPARVLAAIDRVDLPAARKLLAAWPAGGTLRRQIDRAVLTAVVEDLDGDARRRTGRHHRSGRAGRTRPERPGVLRCRSPRPAGGPAPLPQQPQRLLARDRGRASLVPGGRRRCGTSAP